MTRILNPIRAGIAVVMLLATLAPAQAAQANTPEAVIQATVKGIIQVLAHRKDPKTISDSDRQEIRKIISDHFDFTAMSRLSVGAPWNEATPAQQKQFTLLFKELLEYTYGNRLSAYHGQTVKYQPAEFRGNRAQVKTAIVDTNKQIPVEYRLIKDDDDWRVYDIRIEGVSLVATFRTEFQDEIGNKGFESLIQSLQKKVHALKAKG